MHTPRLPALAPLQTTLFDREANVLLDHQRRLSPDAVDMLLALAPYVCPTAIILHVKAGHLVPSAPAAAAAADWPPGPPHVRNFVGAFLLAETPGAQGGEDVAEHGPQRREVGDVDGDGGLAEVPVEVDVGDQARDEAVDFGDDGGDDDEDAHTEDDEEDGFLLEGDADAEEEGKADEENEDVGGGVEDAFGDFVVLVGGALGWMPG